MPIDMLSPWVELAANITVIITVVIAIFTFISAKRNWDIDYKRAIRLSTIVACGELKKEADKLKAILKSSDLDADTIKNNSDLHEQVDSFLLLIEKMSVGIQSFTYDIRVYERLCGEITVEMYEMLFPYISKKSNEESLRHFNFEFLVNLVMAFMGDRPGGLPRRFRRGRSQMRARSKRYKRYIW